MDATEVQYVNTLRDLVRFNVYHLPRMGVMQLLMAGLVAMHAWTFVPLVSELPDPPAAKAFVFISTLIIMLACAVLLQLLFILLSYRPSRNRAILTEHTLQVTETGLVEKTKFNESTFAWTGIPKVAQNRSYIFVYVQQNMAHIIPKRAFATPAEAEHFFQSARNRAAAASGAT